MYASCPSCKTVYSVSAAQLRAAGGRVRCGRCDEVFDTAAALFDDPQEARGFIEQQLQEVTQEIDDLVGRALDEVSATAGTPEPGAIEIPDPGDAGPVDSSSAERVETIDGSFPADMDSYAAPVAAEFSVGTLVPAGKPATEESPLAAVLFETDAVAMRTSWGAIAAAVFLIVLLCSQYIRAERYQLATIPGLRPYLEVACAVMVCDLPLRHDASRLEVLEREIRNHPNVDGALLVSATFANGADFVQGYPIFSVAFSDVSGTPVAVRRFLPDEYLNGVDLSSGIAPGQQTRLMLEIVDPGERAVSFQFDFF